MCSYELMTNRSAPVGQTLPHCMVELAWPFLGLSHLVPGNGALVVAAHRVPCRLKGNPTYLLVLFADHI